MTLVYYRSHIHIFIKRVANAQGVHAPLKLVVKCGRDILLHQQARSGAAHFALVKPDGVNHPFDGRIDVGVIKNDKRGFSTQFKGQFYAAAGRDAADAFAHCR